MATEALKSAGVTVYGTNPPTRKDAGKGAGGRVVQVDGYVGPTTGNLLASTYRFVRVPSNAIIKKVRLESHGTITTLTGDVGVYYSDNAIDFTGKFYDKVGVVVDADFFGTAVAMATADTPTDVTNESGTYDVSKRQKELWDALGLTEDPGGFFDITMTTTATNSLTNSGCYLGCEVEYVVRG